MATSPEPKPSPPASPVSRYTQVQKLAILLVLLGPDSAAQVLKQFTEPEVEIISGEMSKLNFITREMQQLVLQEFNEVALQAGTAIRGGVDYTKSVLERAVGTFRASELMGRVSPASNTVTAMQQVVEMDARQIFNLIKREQPQAIALIISYLNPEKGSQVLALLHADLREEVLERLATLAPTPIEVVERVVAVLMQKVAGRRQSALNQTGGVKSAADILNALEKNLSKSLLLGLEENNPELGHAIRQKMFTFENLGSLDAASLQRILREVDLRDLAVALKMAPEELKQALLACISKRAGETVREEMSFLGPLKLREIEAAQGRIIEAVRRLENEGELDLNEARENQHHAALS